MLTLTVPLVAQVPADSTDTVPTKKVMKAKKQKLYENNSSRTFQQSDEGMKGHTAASSRMPILGFSNGDTEYIMGNFLGISMEFGSYLTNWLYWEVGACLYGESFSGEGTYTSTSTTSIQVPLTMGVALANPSTYARCKIGLGLDYNYLIAMEQGSESMDLDGVDRSSFMGHIRVSLSYFFGIYGEYVFPLGDGYSRFNIGVCIEL